MIKVSEEIILKELTVQDAPLLFNILDGEREYMRIWLPFVDKTQKVDDTLKAIKRLISSVDKQFTVWYENSLVGLIGFKDSDLQNKKTEIGYWISQKAQGNYIITRSTLRLVEFAFEEMHMNRVQIKVAIENTKSRKIPERLGFELEGIERDGELLIDNIFTDIAVYSILKKDFIKE